MYLYEVISRAEAVAAGLGPRSEGVATAYGEGVCEGGVVALRSPRILQFLSPPPRNQAKLHAVGRLVVTVARGQHHLLGGFQVLDATALGGDRRGPPPISTPSTTPSNAPGDRGWATLLGMGWQPGGDRRREVRVENCVRDARAVDLTRPRRTIQGAVLDEKAFNVITYAHR